MEIFVEKFLIPIMVAVTLGVMSFACGCLAKNARQDSKTLEALCKGVRSLLRNDLHRTYKLTMINGGATIEEKEWAECNFKAYEALGGNGTGAEMYRAIIAADVILEGHEVK